jgi:hypothetical protein
MSGIPRKEFEGWWAMVTVVGWDGCYRWAEIL